MAKEKPVDEMTVEELRAKAGELNIEGRSSMGKPELVSAIGSHQGVADPPLAHESKETEDPNLVPEGKQTKPNIGQAVETSGEEVQQVGKHPDVPADVPVQAGDAFGPALYPSEVQKTKVE